MCRVANLAARSSNLVWPQGCILCSGELRCVQIYVIYSIDILGLYLDCVASFEGLHRSAVMEGFWMGSHGRDAGRPLFWRTLIGAITASLRDLA